MTEISFECPNCSQSLEVDVEAAGQQVECPSCSRSIVVPDRTSAKNAQLQSFAAESETSTISPPTEAFHQDKQEKKKWRARAVIDDLKSLNFKEEVIPISGSNLHLLMKDFVFWAVTLLGVVPLFIVTLTNTQTQLTMFALFFAFVWGVIFKQFVFRNQDSWRWPLISLFFTGIIGIPLLLAVYAFLLPEAFIELSQSKNPIISLFGYVFHVGIFEEIAKSVPVIVILLWKRKSVSPEQVVLIGAFSGLGFAAFENLNYGVMSVVSSYELTSRYGTEGLVVGVQNAMIVTMLRAVSLVFCHAVWSGIVGYFIAIAFIRRHKVAALVILGYSVAALLHGFYNWFTGMQPTISAIIAGFSFSLFYGYLSKLRSITLSHTSGEGLNSEHEPPRDSVPATRPPSP